MARKFGTVGKVDVLEKGQITFHLKSENYKGEERFKFVGRIELSDTEIILLNIPVDKNDKCLSYSGKGDNEDKTYMRGYATRMKSARNSRR